MIEMAYTPNVGDLIKITKPGEFHQPAAGYSQPEFTRTGLAIVYKVTSDNYDGKFSYGTNLYSSLYAGREGERSITLIEVLYSDGETGTVWWEVRYIDGIAVEVISSGPETETGNEKGLLVESLRVSYPEAPGS